MNMLAVLKQGTKMDDLGKKTGIDAGSLEGGLKLAGDTFDQAAGRIHEFHRAISDMPFKAVGFATASASKPVEAIHNEVTDLVYDVVRGTGKGIFNGAAWVVRQFNDSMASAHTMDQALDGELSEHAMSNQANLPMMPVTRNDQRRSMVASAVNGLIGDHLAVTRNPIAVQAGFYEHGQKLDLSREALSLRFPQAGPTVVIFAHGLCCNEDAWNFYVQAEEPLSLPYGEKLRRAVGATPLFLRYNTGLDVQANGRRLRNLLRKVYANWPVPIQHLMLVGHSMGGLVSRSAVEQLTDEDHALAACIGDVVSLGTPHSGAPLARLAGAGETLLNKVDLARPVGKVLGVRSTGIRNLQEGLGPLQTREGLNVDFHMIGSTLAGETGSSLINETIGDGLVQMSSALADNSGRAQRLAFAGRHHMQLLNDHEIYLQLEAILAHRLKHPKRLD